MLTEDERADVARIRGLLASRHAEPVLVAEDRLLVDRVLKWALAPDEDSAEVPDVEGDRRHVLYALLGIVAKADDPAVVSLAYDEIQRVRADQVEATTFHAGDPEREGISLCGTHGTVQGKFAGGDLSTCPACLRFMLRRAWGEVGKGDVRHILGARGTACGAASAPGFTVPDALPKGGLPGATCPACLKAEIAALREQRDELRGRPDE